MKEKSKKVLCSAGISHLLLYPNGDVYRCMADYNAKNKPLFNAKDGWKKIDTLMECAHDKCYAGCDIDWATKWVFEEGSSRPQKIESKGHTVNPIDGSHWAAQSLENPLKNMVHIVWAPSLMCNFDCRYCGCAVGKYDIRKEFPSASPELSPGEWLRAWDQICAQYEFGILTMSGGEPLLSKATLPVFKKILHKFAVGITTNLSTNVFGLVRGMPAAGSSRTGFKLVVASLHPTAKGFNRDMFLGAVLCLKKNGWPVTVNFVGHPLQLFLAEEYKQWCKRYGVSFVVSPWCGRDNDGYDAEYTETELRFLNKIAPAARKTQTQVEFRSVRYELSVDTERIDLPLGEKILVKGRLKNTGSYTWSNKGRDEHNSFKVGARVFALEDDRKSVCEGRSFLPKEEIAPGEEFNFEVTVDPAGLENGTYLLKVDLLQEGSFWMENKGNIPAEVSVSLGLRSFPLKARVTSEVVGAVLPDTLVRDTIVTVKMKIKNTGTVEWFSDKFDEDVQVGCRIFRGIYDKKAVALKDWRVYLTKIVKPGDVLETDMLLDFKDLAEGAYVLVFDMVNEGKYWFGQKGSKALIREILLA